MNTPRSEHPRPQFFRESWQNLNGEWDFEFDYSNSGVDRQLYKAENVFSKKITVPFCPESKLSGLGETDFCESVWYRKKIDISKEQLNGRVILHFGAVDYATTVYVNEIACKSRFDSYTHVGGYSSFCLDVTDKLNDGENIITVHAIDSLRTGKQPRGKQSALYHSHACDYTRTTGIWQTVWLEFVPSQYVKSARIDTNIHTGEVFINADVFGDVKDVKIAISASYNGAEVASTSAAITSGNNKLSLKIESPKLWEIGSPCLYDLTLSLVKHNAKIDLVESYFGFRSVDIVERAIRINEKPVFQRLVLDQGFYSDGIYTAPSDEALKNDILLSMKLGFNGARLHQKIFEERFLYWADKLGYIVWGEHASWGQDISQPESVLNFLPEWLEAIERDYNHPAIVGWCPFNETWDYEFKRQDNNVIATVFRATKAADKTRPVIDSSGNYHVITDIYDIHDYEQDVNIFAERYAKVTKTEIFENFPERQQFAGQPYFVSEYGGIRWAPNSTEGWGYGNAPKTEEEFASRYDGLTTALMKNENMCAFCYTQLYDVEQEVNGLYTYDRKEKLSAKSYEIITKANSQKAGIEK